MGTCALMRTKSLGRAETRQWDIKTRLKKCSNLQRPYQSHVTCGANGQQLYYERYRMGPSNDALTNYVMIGYVLGALWRAVGQ